MLNDLSLTDFTDLLASSAPAPGGGSTAALAGALASALSIMVYSLTTGKKAYSELDSQIKQQMALDYQVLGGLKQELIGLVEEDTRAFNQVMEALRLPRQTDAEKAWRVERLQAANRYAAQVPLLVAQKCLALLQHQANIACHGNGSAVSDIGVGALLAYTGLESAVLNVRINLPGLEEEARQQLTGACKLLLEEGLWLKEQIMGTIERRMESILG